MSRVKQGRNSLKEHSWGHLPTGQVWVSQKTNMVLLVSANWLLWIEKWGFDLVTRSQEKGELWNGGIVWGYYVEWRLLWSIEFLFEVCQAWKIGLMITEIFRAWGFGFWGKCGTSFCMVMWRWKLHVIRSFVIGFAWFGRLSNVHITYFDCLCTASASPVGLSR